jgi:hypothetical protein
MDSARWTAEYLEGTDRNTTTAGGDHHGRQISEGQRQGKEARRGRQESEEGGRHRQGGSAVGVGCEEGQVRSSGLASRPHRRRSARSVRLRSMPDSRAEPDSMSPQTEAGNPPPVDAASDGAGDGSPDSAGPPVEAGSSVCTVAADCRTFSNYCGGCACDALGAGKPDPVCEGGTASCLVDPCQGHTAACDATGHCTLH